MNSYIKKIKDLLNPDYIYIVGSSLICDNPNDTDVVFIYKSKNDMLKSTKKYSEYYDQNQKEINNKYNILFNMIDVLNGTARLYAYEFGPYLEKLYGKEDVLKKYNMLENNSLKKEVCLELYRQIMDKIKNRSSLGSYIIKPYRALITCYILDNNDFELTSEQKEIINQVHDNREISISLLKYCFSVISKILIEDFNEPLPKTIVDDIFRNKEAS